MRKMLMASSVPSMIGLFNMENIRLLLDMGGYEVHVACNFHDTSIWPREKTIEFTNQMKRLGIKLHQIGFSRTPKDLKGLVQSYWQMDRLVKKEKFQFIHCHTPVAGVVSRGVCQRNHVKVIYTVHGFHFYDGAPLKNWLLYYPVEKWMSRYTDILITINHEDYRRAKKKFHAKKTAYIPGVGVDTEKFAAVPVIRDAKRQELGISDGAFVLLSVGELQKRKNYRIVIEALRILKRQGEIDNIVYLLVGQGELEGEFRKLIESYGLGKYIWLLGFRNDISELCNAADCFVHPSIREGLGIAPLEAMAAGLPLISSDVNGMKDYTEDGMTGIRVDPMNVDKMVDAIKKMKSNEDFRKECGAYNVVKSKWFDIKKTEKIMHEIYLGMKEKQAK